jgi:hypothetical protein
MEGEGVMQRFRGLWLEELIVAQAAPGFLFCAVWAVMYEIYHEEGAFYTTLIQEIVGSEGFFPYFLLATLLMALPVGMVLDAVREALVGRWLAPPRGADGRRGPAPSALDWMHEGVPLLDHFEERLVLYRHAWVTTLVPAKAAGNFALVLVIFLVWFVVKIVRMSAWHIFSWAFIVGTPLVGLLIVRALSRRCVSGLREFRRLAAETIFPIPATSPDVPQPASVAIASAAPGSCDPLDMGPHQA